MLPNASDIQYFLEVSSTLNISRAAERLGISQPTLSLSIKRLEHALGADLLIRQKTGVKLTRAGVRVASRGGLVIQEWNRLRDEALDCETEVEGRFSIGVHPSVAIYFLPLVLGPLMGRFPKLEMNLSHGLSREMTEEVISFKTDFGIVVNPVRHPDLVILELGRDEMSLWWTGQNQAAASLLIYDPSLRQSQSILGQLKKKKLSFERQIESGNLEVVASLAGNGCGVGILPGRVAALYPRLKKFKQTAPKFEDSICLVYRADTQKTKAAAAIIQSIKSAKF